MLTTTTPIIMELELWSTFENKLYGTVRYDLFHVYRKGSLFIGDVVIKKQFRDYFLFQTATRVIYCNVVDRQDFPQIR